MFDQLDEPDEKQATEEPEAKSPQIKPVFLAIIVLVILFVLYTSSHPDSFLSNLLRHHH